MTEGRHIIYIIPRPEDEHDCGAKLHYIGTSKGKHHFYCFKCEEAVVREKEA